MNVDYVEQKCQNIYLKTQWVINSKENDGYPCLLHLPFSSLPVAYIVHTHGNVSIPKMLRRSKRLRDKSYQRESPLINNKTKRSKNCVHQKQIQSEPLYVTALRIIELDKCNAGDYKVRLEEVKNKLQLLKKEDLMKPINATQITCQICTSATKFEDFCLPTENCTCSAYKSENIVCHECYKEIMLNQCKCTRCRRPFKTEPKTIKDYYLTDGQDINLFLLMCGSSFNLDFFISEFEEIVHFYIGFPVGVLESALLVACRKNQRIAQDLACKIDVNFWRKKYKTSPLIEACPGNEYSRGNSRPNLLFETILEKTNIESDKFALNVCGYNGFHFSFCAILDKYYEENWIGGRTDIEDYISCFTNWGPRKITFLNFAIRKEYKELVKRLLQVTKVRQSINKKIGEFKERAPIHWASEVGNSNIISKLYQYGASLSNRIGSNDPKDRMTPIELACKAFYNAAKDEYNNKKYSCAIKKLLYCGAETTTVAMYWIVRQVLSGEYEKTIIETIFEMFLTRKTELFLEEFTPSYWCQKEDICAKMSLFQYVCCKDENMTIVTLVKQFVETIIGQHMDILSKMDTLLHYTSAYGNVNVLRWFWKSYHIDMRVKKNIFIDLLSHGKRWITNASPFCCAVAQDRKGSNIPILDFIKTNFGVNFNTETFTIELSDDETREYTPLTWACHTDNEKLICCLLDMKASPNDCSANTLSYKVYSPVDTLCHNSLEGCERSMKYLIEGGLSKTNCVKAFTECAKEENKMGVMWVLLEAKTGVDEKNDEGYSALSVACKYRNRDVVQFLVNQGADSSELNNAFVECAKESNYEIMEVLLRAKVQVDTQDDKGQSALSAACESNEYKVAEYLITQKANIFDPYLEERLTPLYFARLHNNRDLIRLLTVC